MKSLITILLLVICMSIYAQNDESTSYCTPEIDTLGGQDVLSYAELMPRYPGGDKEFLMALAENMRYPDQEEIQFSIYLTFVIDIKGNICNACVINKFYNDRYTPLEQEVLNAIRTLPEWSSGYHQGKDVPVRLFIPVRMQMQY